MYHACRRRNRPPPTGYTRSRRRPPPVRRSEFWRPSSPHCTFLLAGGRSRTAPTARLTRRASASRLRPGRPPRPPRRRDVEEPAPPAAAGKSRVGAPGTAPLLVSAGGRARKRDERNVRLLRRCPCTVESCQRGVAPSICDDAGFMRARPRRRDPGAHHTACAPTPRRGVVRFPLDSSCAIRARIESGKGFARADDLRRTLM